MNVAITGSEGYVGYHLTNHLETVGYNVDRLDIIAPNPVDICDESELSARLSGADAVIHLAAIPGVETCERSPAKALRNNLEGTSIVARVCNALSCRLVFASSQAVHGETTYGWTKRVGVEICHRLPDLDWIALEFSNIYGGIGKGTVIETFIEQAKSDNPLTVHNPGTQERNFVHRDDVARSCQLSLWNGSGVVPVCGPDTLSIYELAELVSARTGVGIDLVDSNRPVGPSSVSVNHSIAAMGLRYEPQQTLAKYFDKVLGTDGVR